VLVGWVGLFTGKQNGVAVAVCRAEFGGKRRFPRAFLVVSFFLGVGDLGICISLLFGWYDLWG
jgi:hypothetical protein